MDYEKNNKKSGEKINNSGSFDMPLYKNIRTYLSKKYVNMSFSERVRGAVMLQAFGGSIGYNNGEYEDISDKKKIDYNFSNNLLYMFIFKGGVNTLQISEYEESYHNIFYSNLLDLLNNYRSLHIDKLITLLKKAYRNIYIDNRFTKPHMDYTTAKEIEKLLTEKDLKRIKKIKKKLNLGSEKEIDIKIDPLYEGAGNGSASISSCIGLFYNKTTLNNWEEKLIEVSIETSKIITRHPVGYLGGFTAAYFTALCFEVQKKIKIRNIFKNIFTFPYKLIKILESGKIEKHLKKYGGLEKYNEHKTFFIDMWKKYINNKFDNKVPIMFRKNDTHDSNIYPNYRAKYYVEEYGFPSKSRVFPGMGGHDSVIIAYDCLVDSLYPVVSWEKLIVLASCHIGDADSTASIAAGLFGCIFGTRYIKSD